MLVVFFRALILYVLVVIVMRIMGKRQIGQLQPFELVITIMLAELAAIPMQNTGIPLINGIIPIITLLIAQLAFSYTTLKSERLRGIICGKPSVLVHGGKIVEKELERQNYNLNDLMEQLRSKSYPNIADVEFAILETSGQISVIPKAQKRPIIPEDLKIDTQYEGIPISLIIDGHILAENLHSIGLNEEWIINELKKYKIDNYKEVLYANIDTSGKLFFQKRVK
ncbi:MAG: DUF421 domain-containing protein [Deltaproteobacteria bacterium]